MAKTPVSSDKPLDINILREDGARATLTQARSGPGTFVLRHPNRARRISLSLLALLLFPMVYAVAMPLVSGDLTASWFLEWAQWVARAADMVPGLAAGTDRLVRVYDPDPQIVSTYAHFAGVNLLCIAGVSLVIFGFLPAPRLYPKSDGLQSRLLQDLTKGVRVSQRGSRRATRRVGGAAGGLLVALPVAILALGIVYVACLIPLLADGRFYSDVFNRCAALPRLDPGSLESAPRTDCLDHTIWTLAWHSSIASIAIPAGLLIALNYAIYPVWLLLGRPTRD